MDLARLAAAPLHHPAAAAPAVARAAAELARYLGRMFGRTPALRPHAGPPGAWLFLGAADPPPEAALLPPAPADDAEGLVRPAGDGLAVVAASPRALLAAVYALLETAGCRWSPWGADDEHVPAGAAASAALPALALRPPFARRAWAADLATWHYSMPERLAQRLPADVAFVDWMAKSGGTGFLFIRHANDTRWVIPELADALGARGLALEAGGHGLVELLPRALFAAHPEYFPVGSDGRRTDLGNACASSHAGLGVIAAGARAVCDELGVADLHLWALDLFGGGWCRCPGCAEASPSDQALRVANAAAEEVDGRVYHLAYHDTIPVPTAVRPHARVWTEFAPRERCYAHPLDDPGCATNAGYRDALARHLDLFAGRVDVFEYYADAILFGGCAVPLPGVIDADLACYRRMGVRGVSCLTFGRYSTWAYGPNVVAFARAAAGAPPQAAIAPALAEYVATLERLMAAAVTHGDVLLPPEGPDASRVHAALAATLAAAPHLRHLLAAATHDASPSLRHRLAAERHLLEYTLAALTAVHAWLTARLHHPPGPARQTATDHALTALTRAADHLHAVDPDIAGTWAAHDLDLTLHFFTNTLSSRS